MKEQFGEWYELLKDFITSPKFKFIADEINKDRLKYEIIPPKGSPLFFKIFRDVSPKSLKVIILGQDPYFSDISIYDGYAFSCSNSLRPQPSLQNIIKEMENNYPDNLELDRCDLSYLVKQGVFLVNTALSVRVGQPESHLHLWKPFTEYWIKKLTENYRDIIFLLWGSKSQYFEQFITKHKGHIAIKCSHPSPLGCLKTDTPFIGSKCFIRCNEELIARNRQEIKF